LFYNLIDFSLFCYPVPTYDAQLL